MDVLPRDLTVPIRMGRYLAYEIPNAKFLEITGVVDHCDLGNTPEVILGIRSMPQTQSI